MFVLKKTYRKLFKDFCSLLAEKEELTYNLSGCRASLSSLEERLTHRVSFLEKQILDAQEKNQQLFYKKERELKDQVQLGVIDHKEYHYSLRLLNEIEKALK